MRLLSCLMLAAVGTVSLSGQNPTGPARAQPDQVTKRAWSQFAQISAHTINRAVSAPAEMPAEMQALPELQFAEFFGPIGPRGMDYSEKIRALAGQRVRLRGFMVQQNERLPGLFLFAAMPVKVDTRADCNETDTPPAMLHVFVPGAAKALPWVPGARFISGVLELGARHETDDRISVARLTLDEPARAALFGTPAAIAPLAAQ